MTGKEGILRYMAVAHDEILKQVRIPIDMGAIEAFCRKWNVREFALFGSVLRDDFRPDSDVDVLVTFEESAHPTLLSIIRMQDELEAHFQRKVELLERGGLEQSTNPYIKVPVLAALKVIYAR